jgi:D-amino-acid dehydrogenase
MAAGVRTCDVAVVGGGLVGAALAYELVSAGTSVVLVDRHDAGRATDAGAGILSPQTWVDPDDAWTGFARAAGRHYEELVPRLEEAGVGPCGYAVCGLLSVSIIAGDEPWFDEVSRRVLGRSPREVNVVSLDEARELFPPIGPVRAALHSPRSARVDGRLMGAAFLEAGRRAGLEMMDASVTGIEGSTSTVHRVRTDAGDIACGAVVVAGGAWSPAFARQFRVALPVTPLKGQIVHLELPGADSRRWPIVQPVLSYYLVPWPDGRVACGGTLETVGFDVRPTADGVHQLLRECLTVAPGLGGATVREVRVGLRPASADDRPLLGPLPGWDNAYVATGHGAEGLLLGPYSGALVAAGITGPTPPQLAPFAPGRFEVRR